MITMKKKKKKKKKSNKLGTPKRYTVYRNKNLITHEEMNAYLVCPNTSMMVMSERALREVVRTVTS